MIDGVNKRKVDELCNLIKANNLKFNAVTCYKDSHGLCIIFS